MEQVFWLDPRDKAALLAAIAKQLAGGAAIAFEGDLSSLEFASIPGCRFGPAGPFSCQDGGGPETLAVLPLEPSNVASILDLVLAHGRVLREIVHIAIAKAGELQFLAGDQFHRECVSVGPAVPESFLEELVGRGILRTYATREKVSWTKRPWKR
jgi:hypothetical protein